MSGRKFFPASILTPAFVAGLFFSGSPVFTPVAVAQEIGGEIEELTVTVRRREETVKDVPATVYVFSEKSIERSNITRAGEIALLTPGVSLVDAAEVGDTQVNIRGMNGARDAENSYALVIDGITMTNPAALNREYANLQQIEVLKGPQGAIYGRNASAGAFIINTRKPGEEFGGEVKASAAEDASYRLVATLDGPLGDTLGGSISGDYRTSDGFYKNEFLDRDDITDNMETWSVTGRLLWEPSEKLALDTKVHYGEVDASSITFNSIFHIPQLAVLDSFWYENVSDHQYRWFNNIVHKNDQETSEFSMKLDYDFEFATLTAWGLYSDIENSLGADGTSGAFGFFNGEPSCRSTTAALGTGGSNQFINPPQLIGTVPENFVFSAPGEVPSTFGAYTPTTCDGTQYQERNQKDYSFEVRLTSPGDQQLRWNAGLYYLNIEREVGVSTGIDRLNPAGNFTNASPIPMLYTTNALNPTEQLVWDDFGTDVYSVFGGIAYDFLDSWTVDLAARYDREERDVTNKVPFDPMGAMWINACNPVGAPGGVLNPGQCDPLGTGTPGPIPPKSQNFNELQPKVSLAWDITDKWTTFASLGTSFRSGGFNNSGSEATVNNFINTIPGVCDPTAGVCAPGTFTPVGIKDEYRKETSTAAELGFKSNIANNAVRLEGSAYYTKVDDMQFFEFIVGGFGLLRVVENIDEVDIMGAELAVTWSATDWFDLFVGGSVIDSEIKVNNTRTDTVGNESPYTPETTGNLGAYFNFPVSKAMNLFANWDVSYIGKTWFHVVQAQERPVSFRFLGLSPPNPGGPDPFLASLTGEYTAARRDAYALSNLRLGVEQEKWTAALFATNLFDETYSEEVIPAPEFGGSFGHAGTERRIGADFTWRF